MAQLYRSIVTWRGPTVEEREVGPGWLYVNMSQPGATCLQGLQQVPFNELPYCGLFSHALGCVSVELILPSAANMCVEEWLDTNTTCTCMLLMHVLQAVQVLMELSLMDYLVVLVHISALLTAFEGHCRLMTGTWLRTCVVCSQRQSCPITILLHTPLEWKSILSVTRPLTYMQRMFEILSDLCIVVIITGSCAHMFNFQLYVEFSILIITVYEAGLCVWSSQFVHVHTCRFVDYT